MADINIKLRITEDGNLEVLSSQAKKANKNLKDTARSAQSADRALKGASKQSSNSTKNFSKMSQGITGGLVPAYATLAANIFAVSAAFRFFKEQADLGILEKTQREFAGNTGRALQSVTQRLREASGGMLSFREAAEAAAIGSTKGLTAMELEDFAVGAKKAAASLGRDFEDAFSRIIRGVTKAEPELLDELGITLRLEDATRRYAIAIGKSREELSAFERSQAVAADVQRQLNEMFGEVEVEANSFAKLSKTFSELIRKITKGLLPPLIGFAEILNHSSGAAIAVFGAFALSVAKAALPIESLSARVQEFERKNVIAGRAASIAVARYKRELKEAKIAATEASAAGEAALRNQAEAFRARGNESALINTLANDAEITGVTSGAIKAALLSAEKQYAQHGKIVTGIFKGEDIKRVRHFRNAFKQMETNSYTTTQKIRSQWDLVSARMQAGAARARTAWVGALKAIGSAASLAGAAINRAMRIAGIIGLIVIAKDMVESLSGPAAQILAKLNVPGAQEFLNRREDSKRRQGILQNIESALGAAANDVSAFRTGTISTRGERLGQRQAQFISDLGLSGVAAALQQLPKDSKEFQEGLEGLISVIDKEVIPAFRNIKAETAEGLFTELFSLEQISSRFVKAQASFNDSLDNMDRTFSQIGGATGLIKVEVALRTLREQAREADAAAEAASITLEKTFMSRYRDINQGALQQLEGIRETTQAADRRDAAVDRQRAMLPRRGPVLGEFQGRALDIIALRSEISRTGAEISAKELAAKRATEAETRILLELEAERLRLAKTVLRTRLEEAERAATDAGLIIDNLRDGLQSGLAGAFETIIQGTSSAKDAFINMAKSMLQSLSQVIAKMLVLRLLGGIPGFQTSVQEPLALGAAAGYATGGIARGPKSGYPAVLHGSEAVVPLPNGRSIPVDMRGGANNNVSVNVYIDKNGNNSQTDVQSDSNNARELGIMISKAVQKELQNQKRSGGMLSPYGVS